MALRPIRASVGNAYARALLYRDGKVVLAFFDPQAGCFCCIARVESVIDPKLFGQSRRTSNPIDTSDQYCGGKTVFLRNNVQHPVHSVNQINVPATTAPEHWVI